MHDPSYISVRVGLRIAMDLQMIDLRWPCWQGALTPPCLFSFVYFAITTLLAYFLFVL